MAEGCNDCLREQLGFRTEGEYPLDATLESPEPVYCVDGVPVVTPHKGMKGPFVATLAVTPPTMGTSGALTGTTIPIDWVNNTARTVDFGVWVEGSIFFTGADASILWTFTFGYTYSISSPADAATISTTAVTNYNGPHTLALGFPHEARSVAPGGSINITPIMSYSGSGGAPDVAALHAANLTVMLIGGST